MIQEISHGGWKRNLRLHGATTELVVTLDIGPRIIRYARHHGKNVFVELPEQIGGTGETEWKIRGGHRFWTAPEGDHSYEPDNGPVQWKKLGTASVEIVQPAGTNGFQKTLRVELLENEVVRVTHLLTNVGPAPLDVTPWALSVMAPGGVALIPQPALDLHPSEFPAGRKIKPEEYLPNREMVLWPFTNLSDGRYAFSENFLRLAYRADLPATKLGLKLPAGWIAYQNGEDVFAKHVSANLDLPYPDRGSTVELFTNKAIFELETLAPALPLAPGATRTHLEHWTLRHTSADLRDEEAARAFFAGLPAVHFDPNTLR
jgi:hypothetical protein